jgi:GLPGLI family protein
LKKTLHILIIIFSFYLIGCDGKSTEKSEGIIYYKVTYPKMDKNNFMFEFMPKKMEMIFKNDKYMTNLSAGMGLFKTSFLVDKGEKEFSQLVKLVDKKYILTLKDEKIEESLKHLPSFTIEQTDDTKKILEYICKKAIITMNDGSNDAFTIFYTDQINIESPNWCNQFKGIDGVMLEYQYEKYDVCMRFTATKIAYKKIDDSEFEIDKSYVSLSEADLDKEMQEIFDSFQ